MRYTKYVRIPPESGSDEINEVNDENLASDHSDDPLDNDLRNEDLALPQAGDPNDDEDLPQRDELEDPERDRNEVRYERVRPNKPGVRYYVIFFYVF